VKILWRAIKSQVENIHITLRAYDRGRRRRRADRKTTIIPVYHRRSIIIVVVVGHVVNLRVRLCVYKYIIYMEGFAYIIIVFCVRRVRMFLCYSSAYV